MIIKRNIIITPEKRKNKGILAVDNVPIRIRIIFKGKRLDLNSGLRINLSKWDEKKQRVKNGHFNKLKQSSTEINSTLSDYESKIQDFFKMKEVEDKVPTSDELKEAMREHGIEYFKDVKLAMLEIDGNISIISGNQDLKQTHYRRKHIHKSLSGIN